MNNKTSEKQTETSNEDLATKPEFDHLRIRDDKNFVFHSRRITSDDEATDTGFASTASFDDETVKYDENCALLPKPNVVAKKKSTTPNTSPNTNTELSVPTIFYNSTITPDTQSAKKGSTTKRNVLCFNSTPGEVDINDTTPRATKKSRKDSAVSSNSKIFTDDAIDPASLFHNDMMAKPPVMTLSPQELISKEVCDLCGRHRDKCKNLKFGRFCIAVVYHCFCKNRDTYNEANVMKKFTEVYCIVNDYKIFKPKKSIHRCSTKELPGCLEARSLIFALDMMKWERYLLVAQMSAVFL